MSATNQISAIKTHIAEMNNAMAKIKEEHVAKMKSSFKELFEEFFKEAPNIQALAWSQYTPYFDDGNECVFDIHEIIFITKNFDPDNILGYYEYYDDEYSTELIGAEQELAKDIEKLIRANETVMKDMFGDHAQVIIHRGGMISDDFEHD